jgi:hypothetical protein
MHHLPEPAVKLWQKVLPLGMIFFCASFNLTILQVRDNMHSLFQCSLAHFLNCCSSSCGSGSAGGSGSGSCVSLV